jgi:precorrin-4/cobalt-precorrin-4 C11-methyltransferase
VQGDRGAGKLWLLGAGPGAADLITVRAARVLARADIVVWGKALMTDDLVEEHARPDAERVSWPPAEMADIHAAYDRAARDGLVVARLLWGEPSLYGMLRDEIRAARDRGLDYEIVPGVTALFAAAAALEIDLTVAPESSRPLILSQGRGDPVPVRELARHGATLALFMVGERAEELQRELIAGGYAPGARCGLAHRVSWPDDEVVMTCRLEELAATVAEHDLDRHTIIIVGPALDDDGPGVSPPS